ncbi:MAG: hypothetical protein KatS3mg101_0415 [Patescibacteria group bacterium]|nr:MAG: hypothetical protein KatS3mg101_0415 [Patescibacteria group bacterium]
MKKAVNKMNSNSGFTLVELLVVIGLLGISIGITNDILTSLVRSYSKTQVKNELEQQANFLGLKFEREIRSANDILTPAGGSNTLIIQKSDGTTITYFLENGVMKITYPGPSTFDVTSRSGTGGVTVSCSSFCFTVSNTTPKTVSINMQMSPSSGTGATFSGTVQVNTTVTVRNSY